MFAGGARGGPERSILVRTFLEWDFVRRGSQFEINTFGIWCSEVRMRTDDVGLHVTR